eukprot:CAMPEP_0197499432 /NCGR_PEP_ID=MMETSP1311-20131121/61019_1 /TAXON_ID=464262 /ORGANISM="Genus nov. species nov., Strain RCC856" /LENGTH=101 /DNA_ID=CAMNT_0043045177 /DNA_START=52 /DNA_END=357 /DNA_ORIENTATION=-
MAPAGEGADWSWGEHEMDYILLVKVAGGGEHLGVVPNAEEVDAVKWVGRGQLKQMMREDSGLQWSPWFRIIEKEFLGRWWDDLDKALTSEAYVDGKIHTIL